jgi:hypothetical protein
LSAHGAVQNEPHQSLCDKKVKKWESVAVVVQCHMVALCLSAHGAVQSEPHQSLCNKKIKKWESVDVGLGCFSVLSSSIMVPLRAETKQNLLQVKALTLGILDIDMACH